MYLEIQIKSMKDIQMRSDSGITEFQRHNRILLIS